MSNFRQSIQMLTMCTTLIPLMACTPDGNPQTPSEGVSTKDISVELHVTNNSNEVVNVELMMRSGTINSNNSIYLSGDDNLIVSTMGTDFLGARNSGNFEDLNQVIENTRLMQLSSGYSSAFFSGQSIWYHSQFSYNANNDVFTLIFDRPNRSTSSKTVVALPDEFVIVTPVPGDVISRQSDIIVSWDNTQQSTSMSLFGSLVCISGISHTWSSGELFPDDGIYNIPANTFADFSGVCNLTLRISRTNIGILDPGFTLGGIALGHQIRSVVISTLP